MTVHRRLLVIVLVTTGFVVGTVAQSSSPTVLQQSPRVLSPMDTTLISAESAGSMLYPFRCDADENLYTRMYDIDAPGRAPIKKFNTKGQLVATFLLTASGIKDIGASDYSVTPAGEVVLLANADDKQYVLLFGKDGSFRSKSEISRSIRAQRMAPLGGDKYLLTGFTMPTTDHPQLDRPVTVLIDDRGGVVKVLRFPQDETLEVPQNDPGVGAADPNNRAVTLGSVIAGESEAYVIRRSSPATIYVVSSAGEVTHTFHLGMRGEAPFATQYHAGRLAMAFTSSGQPNTMVRIMDTNTGEETASYMSEGKVGGALSCLTNESLVFLGTEGGHLIIRRAKLN